MFRFFRIKNTPMVDRHRWKNINKETNRQKSVVILQQSRSAGVINAQHKLQRFGQIRKRVCRFRWGRTDETERRPNVQLQFRIFAGLNGQTGSQSRGIKGNAPFREHIIGGRHEYAQTLDGLPSDIVQFYFTVWSKKEKIKNQLKPQQKSPFNQSINQSITRIDAW